MYCTRDSPHVKEGKAGNLHVRTVICHQEGLFGYSSFTVLSFIFPIYNYWRKNYVLHLQTSCQFTNFTIRRMEHHYIITAVLGMFQMVIYLGCRWIAKYPLQLPDLTTLDFYLLGRPVIKKHCVCQQHWRSWEMRLNLLGMAISPATCI